MKTVSRHTICSGGMTGASALHWYWNRVLSGGSLAEVTGYRRATPPVNKYLSQGYPACQQVFYSHGDSGMCVSGYHAEVTRKSHYNARSAVARFVPLS
jgi:hypothetical protein